MELDPRVEVDARATRRLVQLELSDVDVPKRPGDPEVALFVRVLTAGDGRIRVELWERGEEHGARLVSRTPAGSQLIARRVALAAAELARGLRQKRRAAERAAMLEERRKWLAAQAEREKTLDGPRALRPALAGTLVGLGDLAFAGPSLTGELHVADPLRLDLGVSAGFGKIPSTDSAVETLELGLGPAARVPISSLGLELDFSAFGKAGVLSFANVAAVDGIDGQRQTWWARAGASTALEFRLARTTRLSLGFSLGAVLRRVPVELAAGDDLRLGGLFVGSELGLVLTPPAAR